MHSKVCSVYLPLAASLGDQKVLEFQTYYILNFWIKGASFFFLTANLTGHVWNHSNQKADKYEVKPAQVM